jgi:hypothetical protein
MELRLRNFRPRADSYLAAARGPLHYMLRLHEIERRTAEHEQALRERWHELALECDGNPGRFARRWRSEARATDFAEVNELVERHNRWYPAESSLAMDPRTGDYALVNGKDYRLPPLGEEWCSSASRPCSRRRSRGSRSRPGRPPGRMPA